MTRPLDLAIEAEREHPTEAHLGVGARRLVAEVWLLAARGVIDQRSPAADACLDLRDEIDPEWNPLSIIDQERGGNFDRENIPSPGDDAPGDNGRGSNGD